MCNQAVAGSWLLLWIRDKDIKLSRRYLNIVLNLVLYKYMYLIDTHFSYLVIVIVTGAFIHSVHKDCKKRIGNISEIRPYTESHL